MVRLPFGEDVDDLAAHDQGRVVQDARYLDIVFRDGELAVVKDLDEAEDPCLPGKLRKSATASRLERQRG